MTVIVIEVFRAIVAAWIVWTLFRASRSRRITDVSGWRLVLAGFLLLFLGAAIDVTDNFPSLNGLVIVGDTQTEALIEKVVGYVLGEVLLALGIWRWLPRLAELHDSAHQRIEVQQARVQVLRATMRTVQDIVNNALNSLQLVQLEASEKNALDPETVALMDRVIFDTSSKLNKLASLDSVPETEMAVGTGIAWDEKG